MIDDDPEDLEDLEDLKDLKELELNSRVKKSVVLPWNQELEAMLCEKHHNEDHHQQKNYYPSQSDKWMEILSQEERPYQSLDSMDLI